MHAFLACVLADLGRSDEAERFVVEAEQEVGPEDPAARWIVKLALGAVSAAQGRDDDAERFYTESVEMARSFDFKLLEMHSLTRLVRFFSERGRADESAAYEERLSELSPLRSTAEIA